MFTYYSQNYAGIIGGGLLSAFVIIPVKSFMIAVYCSFACSRPLSVSGVGLDLYKV